MARGVRQLARFLWAGAAAGPDLRRAPAVTRRAARPRAQSAVSAEQRALILRNWAALQRSRTGVDGAKAQMLATLSNSGTDTNLQSYNLRTIVVRPPAGARVGQAAARGRLARRPKRCARVRACPGG
jgi:hypothetical protein